MKYTEVNQLRSFLGEVKQLYLVDTSWLLHRSFNAFSMLSFNVGGVTVYTGDIYGFVTSIMGIVNKSPSAAIILALDSPEPDRKKSCLEYKGNREHNPDIYVKLPEIIESVSVLPNVFLAGAVGAEADDVIFSAAATSKVPVTIFASDNDFYQCISDSVKMISSIKKGNEEIVDIAKVREKYGVDPSQLAMVRALKGDKSDNLEGFPRLLNHFVVWFAKTFREPSEVLSFPLGAVPEGFRASFHKILDNFALLDRNYGLMKLKVITYDLFKADGVWSHMEKYGMGGTITKLRNMLAKGN